ncbi:TauD/TfdA family dioxygenase [Mesorhizobium mediterraneum]|uniref:TauD/TfdA family dioxygenase n=1 Tax=Mesorhizobium mediterraneum TaxID=43617 RepID=UPI00178750D0|nr:TauD/TfdA family dioxygenase [Mesorhizobium mediterraneum]
MESLKTPSSRSFAAVRPKAVRVSSSDLVRMSALGVGALPVVLEPAADGVDLRAWAQANGEQTERLLHSHGGILFRGFGVASLEAYEQITHALCHEIIEYGERSSPRTRLSGRVYTSTDHPSDQPILLHNEQSYTLNWPLKIFFHCVVSAATGGATPIADSRRIYQRLDAALVDEFRRRQVLYVRNYGDGLGLPWQEAFQTTDRSQVEAHCRAQEIEWHWRDGDRLRTRQIRPAVRPHPVTGEDLWFNHALFFHFTSLAPAAQASILGVLNRDEVPFDTFYGDGGSIETATLAALRQAYDTETMRFDWQPGDILMLDNMLACHGREPFTGQRKIVVTMGDPFRSSQQQEA